MSILAKLTTGRRGRAQKVVISGSEGVGKSTIAAQFPEPLFADIEGGTDQLDVTRLTRTELPTLKAMETALAEIAKAKPCKTLVIDTIDWLEQMAVEDMIEAAGNPKITGVEDFGYGKGYTILKERFTVFLSRLDAVIAAGIHVVLLAHSKVTKFEPPDGAGPYDRYELKLSKQVAPLIKEWADMLLFCNWRVQVKERDKNESGAQFKAVGGRERLMYCNRSAAWDAKNRHGMADVEKMEISVIEKAFIEVGAPWGDVVATKAPQPSAEPEKKFEAAAAPREVAPETKAVSVPATPEPGDDHIPGLPVPPEPELKLNPTYARVCAPHAEAITAYLREARKITATEDWRHVPEAYQNRVATRPDEFIKHALSRKAVAA